MLAVLLTLAAQSPDLGKPVTLRTVAKPVSDILQDVSAQTGFTFVANQVREWPVIVSVKDLPVGQLLTRLAEVTDAEWRKEDKQWTLERGPARVRKAVKVELADRAARLKPAVDALPTELTEEDLTKAQAEVERLAQDKVEYGESNRALLGGPSPSIALLHALIRDMPITEIAALPSSSFISYSNLPSPGQRRLAAVPDQTWRMYMRERERFSARVKVPAEVLMIASRASQPIPRTSKLTLILSRPHETADIQARILVLDQNRRIIDMAETTLPLAPIARDIEEPRASGSIRFRPEGQESIRAPGLVWLPNWSSGTSSTGSDYQMVFVDPVRQRVVEFAKRAVKSEPMGFAISDWLLDLADKEKENLVACIPDYAYAPLMHQMLLGAAHEQLWHAMPNLGLSWSRSGDALAIYSRSFFRADAHRVNRVALRKFFDACVVYGRPSFDDVLEYASSSPKIIQADSLDATFIRLLLGRTITPDLRSAQVVSALRVLREVSVREPQRVSVSRSEMQIRYREAYDAFLRLIYAINLSNRHLPLAGEFPVESQFDPFGEPVLSDSTIVLDRQSDTIDRLLLVLEDGSKFATGPAGLGAFSGLKAENITGNVTPVLKLRSFHPAKVTDRVATLRAGAVSVSIQYEDVTAQLGKSLTVNELPPDWRTLYEQGRKIGEATQMNIVINIPP